MNSEEENISEEKLPGLRLYQVLWRLSAEMWRHGTWFHSYKAAAEYGKKKYGWGNYMVQHKSEAYVATREEQLWKGREKAGKVMSLAAVERAKAKLMMQRARVEAA